MEKAMNGSLVFIRRFSTNGITTTREAVTTRKSRLATLSTAAALTSALLLIAPPGSYAMIPADGGAGSSETAKQKKAAEKNHKSEKRKSDKHKSGEHPDTRALAKKPDREGKLANVKAPAKAPTKESKSKWYSLGCGTKGGGAVPWGNVAAPTKIRVKSMTVTGAAVQWSAGGSNNAAAWAPPLKWATFTRGSVIGTSPGSKASYSWATQPGATAQVCAQGRGFG
jgi:hypothetical protein